MSATPVEPSFETSTVLPLLERQSALYRELRKLAERQRQLIVREQTTGLMGLLAERQRITAELGELGKRLAPYRREWKRVREALGADQQRAEALLSDVEQVLRDLLETDAADARLLSVHKAATRGALHDLNNGQRAAAAYGQASAGTHGRYAAEISIADGPA